MPQPSRKSAPGHTGFLNFNKPIGITSMDALRRIKALTGQRRKVGHAGTMDPLAQGVLPICFGQATRLMEHALSGTKRYRVDLKLGETTATYDAEAEPVFCGDPSGVTADLVEAAFPQFIGLVQQTPPMYSAVKINGQRLYKLARSGIEVERQPRDVDIFDIGLARFDLPCLTLEVECGRGVYMRSLAHDLGAALGCGAYVTGLVRSYSGGFPIEESITLEELEACTSEGPTDWLRHLHPVDAMLRDLRSFTVPAASETLLKNGQPVGIGNFARDASYFEQFRLYSPDGRFLALARCDLPANVWRPIKVFDLDTPSPYAPVGRAT